MKKLLLVLMAFAVLALLSCPSEPDKKEEIEEYDFTLVGGENSYHFKFTTPVVQTGKTYVVTFTIEDCDEDLVTSRMGGKIMYKMDYDDKNEKGKVLSGWDYCAPAVVYDRSGVFKWIFKAGEQNEDDVEIVDPATTPNGAEQYFALTVQDSEWVNYSLQYEFKIKGSFSIKEQAPPSGLTLKSLGTIQLTYGGQGHDENKGIGNIEGAELQKLLNPTTPLTEYAFLRISVTGCDITQKKLDDGNSVGSIGNRDPIKTSRDDVNPNAQIKIPKTANVGNSISFTADVLVEDALIHILTGETHLFVNMWDGVNAGIELFDYQ